MTFELSGMKIFELSSMTKMTKNKVLKPWEKEEVSNATMAIRQKQIWDICERELVFPEGNEGESGR